MVGSSFIALLCLLIAVLLQSPVQASAFSQQTFFGNSSRSSPSGATTTGCAKQCFRTGHPIKHIWWAQMSITETVTAETLVLVINNRTNATRTSTIFNTELDLGKYTKPTTVNAAGTVTTAVVLRVGSTNSTRYVAFPTTAYEDYPSTYSLCGTLATTVNGIATCLTYQDGCDVQGRVTSINSRAPVFTYPSHPPLPESVQNGIHESDLLQDPRGWTYSAMIEEGCESEQILSTLFPDLGLWSCVGTISCANPAMVHNTALLLTATSTSHEIDAPVSVSVTHLTSGPLAVTATRSKSLFAEPTTSAAPIVGPSFPMLPPLSSPVLASPASAQAPAPPVSDRPQSGPESKVAPPGGHQPENGPVSQPPIAATDNPLTVNLSPMTSSSMNAQGFFPLSSASAQGIPIPGTQSESQEQKPEAVTLSPVAEFPGKLPTTSILVSMTYVNAHGSTIVSTNQAAAIPVEFASTKANGNIIVTTRLSPMPPPASVPPAQLVPVAQSSTNAQGSVVVSTYSAVSIPVLITSTNAKGETLVSTSVSIAPATAYAPIIIGSTNAQGVLFSSTSYQPGVVFTSTNAQGSQIVTTSPILPATSALPALTIGPKSITANSQNQYIIGSQTLTPGGAITVSGTPISLLPGGAQAVVGSTTQTLTPRPLLPYTAPPALTIGTQTITANSLNQYIMGSQTLTPGGVVTVSGTRVSLGLDKTNAVVGISTEALGSYIMAGLGGAANATAALPFTGRGESGRRGLWIAGVVLAVGMGVVVGL